MPFIATPNTLLVKLMMNWSNQVVVNDFWFKYNSTPGLTERTDLATAFHTFWTSHYKPLLSNQVALTEIDVIDQSSQFGPVHQLVISPPEAGSVGTGSVVLNVSIALSLRTAQRGRNYRGRNYVPGIPAGAIASNSAIDTGTLGNLITAFAWLMDATHTAAGIWSVVSHFLNKAPRGQGVATPITAVTSDALWDSQRRRLVGRGQ